MVNNTEGAALARQAQVKKYGSEEAYRAEMGRRAKMRKTIGKGGFYDPDVAKKAGIKSGVTRRAKSKNRETESQDESVGSV